MKNILPKSHKSFQYKLKNKRYTIVEFDVFVNEDGEKVARNISLTSNWRAYFPNNPTISSSSKGEYGFLKDGVLSINGDIQQIIKRIYQILEESND